MTRTYEDGYRDAMAEMARRLAAVTRWEHQVEGELVVSMPMDDGAWVWTSDMLAACESETSEEMDTCQ